MLSNETDDFMQSLKHLTSKYLLTCYLLKIKPNTEWMLKS